MTTSYYTFELGDQNVGYFEITEEPNTIYQKAQFRMGDDEILNIFHLKLDDGNLTAFKYQDDGEWVEMSQYDDDCFPGSAYPLLIEKANPTFRYQAIYEGSAEITGEMIATRDEGHVIETENGETRRQFWVSDGQVTQIDWGGPISRLVGSKEEAVAGSSYA